jgi:hypothetical protein
MGLNKRTYTDQVTVITAENLNEIQDAIIAAENTLAGMDTKALTDLLKTEIENTTQNISFAEDGTVQSVTHMRNSSAVRTDVFTFTAASITEVRTLGTGQSLTIVTDLTTLQSVITYAAS